MGFPLEFRVNRKKQRESVIRVPLRPTFMVACGDRMSRLSRVALRVLWSGVLLTGLAVTHTPGRQSTKPPGDPSQSRKGGARMDTVAEAGATAGSVLGLPFKRAWEYLTDRTILLAPTVDGDRIYQPLREGRVICLDRRSGHLLWSSDSGGRLTAPVAASSPEAAGAIFITSEKINDDGATLSGSIRALDPATGVALWARDYARPFKSPIVIASGRLYIGSADGSLYAISSADGHVVWKVQTQDVV